MTWAALQGRRLPVERVTFPLDRAAHEAAARAVQQAAARGDVGAVESARAALEALPVLAFEVRTLLPGDWEALVDAHPATAEQQAQGYAWDVKALRFPALAATVTLAGEPPITVEKWRQVYETGGLGPAEIETLYGTVLQLNARATQVSLGKD